VQALALSSNPCTAKKKKGFFSLKNNVENNPERKKIPHWGIHFLFWKGWGRVGVVRVSLFSPGWPPLLILLPQPPKCWDYRYVPPHSTFK
jgi:hypothetical protein